MITKERAQVLAEPYGVEVIDAETLHGRKKLGYIADYIKLQIKNKNVECNIFIYISDDYNIVSDKKFYIESKIKNALYNAVG